MNIQSIIQMFNKNREESGMTQAETARLMGISQSALALVTSGMHEPRWDKLQKMATVMGCKLELKLVPDSELRDEFQAHAAAAALKVKASDEWKSRNTKWQRHNVPLMSPAQLSRETGDSDPHEIPRILWSLNEATRDYQAVPSVENKAALAACISDLTSAGWVLNGKDWIPPSVE